MSDVADTVLGRYVDDPDSLPADAVAVGVTREPSARLRAATDRTVPALGLPADVAEELHRLARDFRMQGLCAEGAHNAAYDEVDAAARYRDHLVADEDAAAAVDDLVATLRAGTPVVLVCEEPREGDRCHRRALRRELETRLGDRGTGDGDSG